MATRYSIFPSVNEDRIYYADDFLALPSRDFLAGESDGVSRETGSAMAVVETSPATLAVDVSTGVARVNGYRFEVFTAAEEVSLDAADPSDDRIDRIVVQARLDSANRDARLHVLKGTPDASPAAPALTRDADTYEISLAQVLVGAGVSSVSDSEITDERGDEDVCGWLRPQLSGYIVPVQAGTDSGTDAYQFDLRADLQVGDEFVADIDSPNTTATPTGENTGGGPAGAQSIVDENGDARVGMLQARPHRFQWDGTNMVVLDPNPLHSPFGNNSVALALDTWRTPNADRAVFVLVEVRARTDGATSGQIKFATDHTGGTNPDYKATIARSDDVMAGGGDVVTTGQFIVVAGGSYRAENTADPTGANAILQIKELTL